MVTEQIFFKKKRPLYILHTRGSLKMKDTQTGSEGMEKDIQCKWKPKKAM